MKTKVQNTFHFRLMGLLIGSAMVAGCVVWPMPPKALGKTSTIVQAGKDDHDITIQTATDAHNLVDGLYAITRNETYERLIEENVANDATFYGTLLAVIGVTTKGIAARNVGAGVAGISAAVAGHYQFSAQRIAFDRANSRAKCLKEALNDIDDDTLALFDGKPLSEFSPGTPDPGIAWSDLPKTTISSVDSIISGLRSDLLQINTGGTSLSDIQSLATKVRTAADSASKVPVPNQHSQAAQNDVDAADTALNNAKTMVKQVSEAAKPATKSMTRTEEEKSLNMARLVLVQPDLQSITPETEAQLAQTMIQAQKEQAKAQDALNTAKQALASAPYKQQRFIRALLQYDTSTEACLSLAAAPAAK